MADVVHSYIGLLRSRLSRRIVFWVFLSILAIEGIIFVPSFYRRRKEKLRELEVVSSEVFFAIKSALMVDSMGPIEMFRMVQSQLKPDSVILGAALYSSDCRLADSFGDRPQTACSGVDPERILRGFSTNPKYYEVAWPRSQFQGNYVLIIRHDASQVRLEMVKYALAIAGLIIIISAFVTLTTVWVLGRLLIHPLLSLRDDLLAAGEALTNNRHPDFTPHSLMRKDELGDVAHAFSQMYDRVQHEIQERRQAEKALKAEQEKTERLLQNILPAAIAEQLKQNSGAIASRFEEATILFADIVDFTGLSAQVPPTQLVCLLNDIFSTFDSIADRLGLEKIKTIGDAYMVVGGLPQPSPNHAETVMIMAIEMMKAIRQFRREDGSPFHLRIGINSGPVVAGVIGIRKFSYDLWGDAVNIASRMESHGIADCIQVSQTTYAHLKHRFPFKQRGPIAIKGRGEMLTYLYCEMDQILARQSSPPHSD